MPTQNTNRTTEIDSSQPLLHQHEPEIQPYSTLRNLPIAFNSDAHGESCALFWQILLLRLQHRPEALAHIGHLSPDHWKPISIDTSARTAVAQD